LLALVAGAAWTGWTYALPHYTHVPRVQGLSVRDAEARLKTAGAGVAFGDPVFSSTVPAGLVIRTSPPPGTRMKRGSTVTLIQSAGPELLPIPDVRGLTQDEATRQLTRAGFRTQTARQFDEAVPKGNVVSQSPAQGTKLERGSAVTIVVSRGPQPVIIPDLAGQPAGNAAGTLKGLGLKVTETDEYSVAVARGNVIRTEPPIGTELAKGSPVTLVVSKGPKTFAMPDVLGLSSAQARAKLEALGLHVDAVQLPGSIGDTVAGQDPTPGQTVTQGDTVKIYVGG
jgi:serine/threonine-protein kinase